MNNLPSPACPDSKCGDINLAINDDKGCALDMKNKSDIFDDITKLAGGAAGTLHSMRSQVKNDIKARVEEVAMRLDLVPREDLDRVEALLEKTIKDQKDLIQRLEKLEK